MRPHTIHRLRLRRGVLLSICLLSLGVSSVAQDLPPFTVSYSPLAVASDGTLVGYLSEPHRVEVQSTGMISRNVIDALIGTEDRDFYSHNGVSLKGLGRALWNTLTGKTQGGSTLTMQLARTLFLTREKTVSRKLREMELAKDIEKKYNKDQILLLYLNTVYFGRGAYGIWAAAMEYYGKTPDKLSRTEAAMIVGLLKAPSAYEPSKRPDKALSRRNEVLHNLVETGKISELECTRLKAQPLGLHLREDLGRQATDFIRREAAAILARLGRSLQEGDLRVTTTLDPAVQRAAQHAVAEQWKRFPAAMQTAQVGLASVEARSGAIRAMLGGNPVSESRGLNRAASIRRQPGSSFKPFLYATLLEKGLTLATPILDAPIVVDSGLATAWRPMNDDDSSSGGRVTMRFGIRRSLNLVAAHAMVEFTTPKEVADFAHRCGITASLPEVPSLALGTGEVSPLEMASALGVFASEGLRAKPFSVLKIEDRKGVLLYAAQPDTATVVDSATAYLVTDALRAVVDSGTASSIRTVYSGPAAGKTGTTQQSTDAWFAGYTPELSTAIWMGFDNAARKLGGAFRYGGSTCAPIWGRMMAELASTKPVWASGEYRMPTSITLIELCEESGLLALPTCPKRAVYPINALKAPGVCAMHGEE
ncbi:MAG: transglycosylase domain-containing protein [Ignavibacteria bacterium]|nr:transglycosylase domain-containing protein [Ignavibacteria bacterium]